MAPVVRKLALAIHLTCSVGWVGAVAAYLALDVTVATSQDPQAVQSAWIAMDRVVAWTVVPMAGLSLLTGLVMALGTRWGLFRHWWVLISLMLTIGATLVLLSEAGVIRATAAMAADARTSADQLLAMPSTLPHSVGGLGVLLVIQVLNIYKPAGLTRYGWRKHQEERRATARRQRNKRQTSSVA
jgi:hypothetical protein